VKHSETLDKLKIIDNQMETFQENHHFHRTGQLRRAKLHAACFIESLDNHQALSPALRRLLEASLVFDTMDTKILAAYLKQSPATIRSEFQKIRATLGYSRELQKASGAKT